MKGAKLRSSWLEFTPGKFNPKGKYITGDENCGCVNLVIQSLIPVLIFSYCDVRLVLNVQ